MLKPLLGIAFLALSVLVFGCKLATEPVAQDARLDILPSWSGDGATVAFTGIYNGVQGIYMVDTAGTNLRLVVAGNVAGCSWSPDSKWLTYSGADGIYKIKINGDSALRLTTISTDESPSWSPDGRWIAFVRLNYGVMVYDLQTGSTSGVFGSGIYPSWHSNGDIVVQSSSYLGSNQGTSYNFDAVRADSSNWRPLYSFPSFNYFNSTSVNPVGATEQEIAFSMRPWNDYSQIWKVTLATGIRTQLTLDGGRDPAWSPDGKEIVYTRTLQGDGGLWIMKSDGSGKRRLTSPS